MSNTDSESITTPIPAPEATPVQATAPGTYPMSKEGKRQAIILLLGVISIWVFALWSFITILQDGVTGVEWVSGLLMLGILVVAPVVAWTLLEEANSVIVTNSDGLTYSTLGGIRLHYAWPDIAGFDNKERKGRLARFFLGDDDSENDKQNKAENNARTVKAGDNGEILPEDEPDTKLLNLRNNPAGRITNPVVRFLHRQAHGDALPIYGALENRQTLLGEIATHIQ